MAEKSPTTPMKQYSDVLIVGAGPVGLLVALGLAQQGVDTVIVEKKSLLHQQRFGRACTLYPRTLELLEQVDVADDVIQRAFIGKDFSTYSNGKRVTRKAFQSMFPMMSVSFHDFITNIRQNSSQEIFASKYEQAAGEKIHHGWEATALMVDRSPGDGYNVTVALENVERGRQLIRCKYVVGADGAQSKIRSLAGIEMEGSDTIYKWVRIDGLFKTDLPEPDVVFASVESPTHGPILWAKLDGDAHRVGFPINPTLQAKYSNGLTEADVKSEAIKAFKPFSLEFERVDWWTYYTIKQKVANMLQKNNYILLAGDAAHTHSSAFAQGMNTGVHDATNLAWKLGGTVHGWYKPEVLETFASERRSIAQQLIAIDKMATQVVSGDIPEQFRSLSFNLQDAMDHVMGTNMAFTIGLGIKYELSAINKDATATNLISGTRSPDCLLHTPGPSVTTRIHTITHKLNRGRWSVLVFVGHAHRTKDKIQVLRENRATPDSYLAKLSHALEFSTIMVGTTPSAWSALDGPALGKLYFDLDSKAHGLYGVYPDKGAVVFVRPDGIVAFATELDGLESMQGFCTSVFS